MAAILPQGKTQFLDGNGAPLALGKVWFYALGTTTLKATYQDINLTTPNVNPVLLDANGAAFIWGSGQYSMVVQDASGVQVYAGDTQAPISTSADIASALGYTPATAAQGAKADAALSGIYLIPMTTGGTASAYTATPSTAVGSYANGQMYILDPHVDCAAGATLSISGLPAAPIKTQANGVLTNVLAGEILQGQPVNVVYSSGNFIITNNDKFAVVSSLQASQVANLAAEAVLTTGTSTAYAVTSPLKTLVPGVEVAILPHVTSGSTPTLAVNSLGAVPIRYNNAGTLTAVPQGALKINAPAILIYDASGAWVMKNPMWAIKGDVTSSGRLVDAAALGAGLQGGALNIGTPVATTSGTAVTFSGIPAWAKRIVVNFSQVVNASNLLVQLGSGGIVTTGYSSTGMAVTGSNATAATSSTAGMIVYGGTFTGRMVFESIGSNKWVCSHTGMVDASNGRFGGGSVALSGAVDSLTITSSSGTGAFSAGLVNIMWE